MTQRPIKFRAWDDTSKKMWFPSAVAADGRNVALVNHFGVEGEDTQGDPVMQFTGLHDKNGKEIWEGDVLWNGKYDSGTGARRVAVVENWENEPMSFGKDHRWGGYSCELDFPQTMEVIGNIYETPELLKQ